MHPWGQSLSRICESHLPDVSIKFCKFTLLQCKNRNSKVLEKLLGGLSRKLSEFSFSCIASLKLQLALRSEDGVMRLCFWIPITCVYVVMTVKIQSNREPNSRWEVKQLSWHDCTRYRSQIDTAINKRCGGLSKLFWNHDNLSPTSSLLSRWSTRARAFVQWQAVSAALNHPH